VGSSGALGSSVCQHFLNKGLTVIGADVVDSSETAQLHHFVPLQEAASLGTLTARLANGVRAALGEMDSNSDSESSMLLDVIVVASGGWESDPKEDTPESYGDSIDRMMRRNLHPVVAAGYCAQHYCDKEALVVVLGATAALTPTPGMMGYGLSKTAAHTHVQTLGAMTGSALQNKSQRAASKLVRKNKPALDDMTVVGILPTKIDTPSNRRAEPKADFTRWTRPSDVAKEIGQWVDHVHLRPHSGSLIKVFSSEEGSTFQLAR